MDGDEWRRFCDERERIWKDRYDQLERDYNSEIRLYKILAYIGAALAGWMWH